MKLSAFFAITAAELLALTACSNSENDIPTPPAEESPSYMEMLSRGDESACFTLEELLMYRLDPGAVEWKEENWDDYDGLSLPTPSTLTIHEGRTWTPLNMFSSSLGPSPLSMPLLAYRNVTGFDKKFYVATPVEYDREQNSVTIKNTVCSVLTATPDKLVMTCTEPFWVSGGGEGKFKWNMTYVREELTLPDMDKIVFYDSELEANLAIIDMLREEFGNVFNINEYLGGYIYLDDPIVNLDEVEKEIREYWC